MIITVSRQAYSNGSLVGRLVGERLGYPVFDRELVDEMARLLQVEPKVVSRFDEATLHPVEAMLLEWRESVNEQSYRRYLRQALERIAEQGDAVIIGRGANFVLRGPDTLHVRIIAPLSLRIGIYRAGHDVSERGAGRAVHAEDRARARFVRSLFSQSVEDPMHYDLVINLAGMTPDMAADHIVHAAKLRASNHVPPEPRAMLPLHVEIMSRHRRPVRPEIVKRGES